MTPRDPILDEDLEAHGAQADLSNGSIVVIGYIMAAFIMGALAALPVALRWLS